ncbi:MAG: hypothetical protein EPN57_19370 [Paraburkholderia sp.]|nr:MAG: hypothetical protein EPN57_19370 [Paraburkholderia sp.]
MPSQAVLRWFASFAPHPVAVSWRERLRSCFGALLGIAATGAAMHWLFGPQARIPLLIAPTAAAAWRLLERHRIKALPVIDKMRPASANPDAAIEDGLERAAHPLH